MNDMSELAAFALKMTARMPGGALKASALITPFSKGGSNRYFFRLSDDRRSATALVEPGAGREFENYISVGNFLWSNGIGVPEFYSIDRVRGIIVMEDLGDLSLEIVVKKSNSDKIISLYKRCLDLLYELQTDVTDKLKEEEMLSDKIFDKSILIGETDYFEREFLGRFQPRVIPKGWKKEKEQLADILSSQPRVFMHRDFQSRNIIIKNNRPRIIDFQTAHLGPGIYDTVSLLKDPYAPLANPARDSFLEYFYNKLKEKKPFNTMSFEKFTQLFATAGIQRNLQALAAFAKLGYRDGKKVFLKSIPAGLRLLEEGAGISNSYPAIKDMATRLRNLIKDKNHPFSA